MPATPRVGVLALQGDFEAHERALARCGAQSVQVRTAEELNAIDALVMPGGESTTMLKLLNLMNLKEPVREFLEKKPGFGTCAGAILMAKEVLNPAQESFGLIDLTVERNGYGRQIDSRIAKIEIEGHDTEAVFIRAPIIRHAGPDVHVLASYNGDPVLVEQGRYLAATFHPELTPDSRIHQLFLNRL